MAGISGYNGSIEVDNTTINAHRWALTWKVDEHDISVAALNGNSGNTITTLHEITYGLHRVDLNFEGYWDPSYVNLFRASSSPNLRPGTRKQLITITPDTNTPGVLWSLFDVLILTAENMSGVRDTVHYQITAVVNGAIMPPSF